MIKLVDSKCYANWEFCQDGDEFFDRKLLCCYHCDRRDVCRSNHFCQLVKLWMLEKDPEKEKRRQAIADCPYHFLPR